MALGTKIYVARRWLRMGSINFQPSELMKVGIFFVLAKYLADEQSERSYIIRDLQHPLNVSRTAMALIALLVLWSKNPVLRDPVGELARKMAISFEGRAPEWDGTFTFRILLVTAIIVYTALAWFFYRQGSEPVGG